MAVPAAGEEGLARGLWTWFLLVQGSGVESLEDGSSRISLCIRSGLGVGPSFCRIFGKSPLTEQPAATSPESGSLHGLKPSRIKLRVLTEKDAVKGLGSGLGCQDQGLL